MARSAPAAKKSTDERRLVELIDRMTDRRSAITKLEAGGYVDDEDLDGGEGLAGPNPKIDPTAAIESRWGAPLPPAYATLLRARGRRHALIGGMTLFSGEELLRGERPVLARGGGQEALFDPFTGAVSVGAQSYASVEDWLIEENAAQRSHLLRLSVEADPTFSERTDVRRADATVRAALLDAELKLRGLG